MNVLSLFDGMSCGQIALERAGVDIDSYYASEIDKYAIQVTQKNYPNTVQLGDITKLDERSLPRVDLLMGGSPCQSFSFAGRQKGMSTKDNLDILSLEQYLKLKESGFEFEGQSYLFWEYVRILEESNPKYFLLENVKMSKKWESVITEILGVEPTEINSNLVSAQDRKRLYWTNIQDIEQPDDRNILLKNVLNKNNIIPLNESYFEKEKWENRDIVFNRTERTSRIRRRGHGYLPFIEYHAEKIPAITVSPSDYILEIMNNIWRKPDVIETERFQTVPLNYTLGVSNTQRQKMLGNGWTVDVIAHIFKGLKRT